MLGARGEVGGVVAGVAFKDGGAVADERVISAAAGEQADAVFVLGATRVIGGACVQGQLVVAAVAIEGDVGGGAGDDVVQAVASDDEVSPIHRRECFEAGGDGDIFVPADERFIKREVVGVVTRSAVGADRAVDFIVVIDDIISRPAIDKPDVAGLDVPPERIVARASIQPGDGGVVRISADGEMVVARAAIDGQIAVEVVGLTTHNKGVIPRRKQDSRGAVAHDINTPAWMCEPVFRQRECAG